MRIQLDRDVHPPSASRPAEKPPPECMGAQTKDAFVCRSEYQAPKPRTGEPGEMSSNYLVPSVLFCPSSAPSPQSGTQIGIESKMRSGNGAGSQVAETETVKWGLWRHF